MAKPISYFKVWISILLFFNTILAFPQFTNDPLRFQKITTEQGLPHNFVRSITQDNRGFIWIGTNYGLARYDGYDFKVFQPDSRKTYSIAHKSVDMVFADSKDNLWISYSTGGISKMDLTTEQFIYYTHDSSNKKLLSNEFSVFYEDSDTNLWVVSPNGIFRYNEKQDNFSYALAKNTFKIESHSITSFTDDGCGNIWFTQNNNVWILEKKTYKLTAINSLVSNAFSDDIRFSLAYSKDKGKIWLGTYNYGLFCYNVKNQKIEKYLENIPNIVSAFMDQKGNLFAISNSPLYKLFVFKKGNISKKQYESYRFFESKTAVTWTNITVDRFGNIYINSPAGLAKFNFESGLNPIESNIIVPNSISNDHIEKLFIDRTDNIWITPQRKGINKADLRQKPFKLYTPNINSLKDIPKDRNVTSIYEDKQGYIWIGNAENGLGVYDKKSGKYFNFFKNTTVAITAIYEDIEGNIWLGWDFLYKIKRPEFNNLMPSSDFSDLSFVFYNIYGAKKIISDTETNLWIASLDGLIEFNRATNEFVNHSMLYDSLNKLDGFLRTVFIDKNQNIWAGSNSGGLCKYVKSENSFKHFLNNLDNPKSISNNTVYDIYGDNNGYLWIGTRQGLEKFNPETESFEHVGILNEINKRSIFCVIPDSDGKFWMSSDIGIIRFETSNQICSFYGQADGLQSNEFSTTANFISKTGEIYFGGTEGLISFIPSEIKTNPIHPKPVITNLRVFNKILSPGDSLNGRVLLNKQVWLTNKITLNYNETDFTIEFSALHYSAPNKNKYYYKLEGFNSNWIETDSKRRYATFTGLPPGDYTFILKATNNDGLMCLPEDEVQLSITIVPPFWLTIWFKILVIVFIIAIISFYVRNRLIFLKNKNIILDKKVKERTEQLELANKFLEQRSRDLEEVNTYLEESQEEINLQKEEIQRQYKSLENSNRLLKQHQEQIIEQNIELDKHRNTLEYLVEERTRDLERALIKAEESDKLKTSFLTNISHEIRTPMNAIIGFSSLLKDENFKEKHSEFINLIETNGLMLITLINNILELSSIESQQVSVNPQKINIVSILNSIYTSFKIEAEQKNLILNLSKGPIENDLLVYLDENLIKQVFTNLLSNAIKFTEIGTIEFGISEISNNITFFVKDTGIGIPETVDNHVFDRFYKIEGNKNQLYRGTGLGLAISKGLVTLWNGDIWFVSAQTKGTTFYFTYPLQQSIIDINKTVKDRPNLNLSGKNILIAEDEESNYHLLESYLLKTKATLHWVRNGLEAINTIKEQNIDLILMDIKMPVMDGIEASAQIKKFSSSIPIIAQTAYALKSEIEEILKSGVDSYIIKPIKQSEILELIRKFLNSDSNS